MGDDSEREIIEAFEGVESVRLDEAISILGEQTRMQIIVELGKAWDERRHQQKPLGFSELMDSVGVSDSGRFNYHLDKLVGTFVSKTEDGYVLLNPGRSVYQIMVSGTLTERGKEVSIVAGECPSCSGEIRVAYRADNALLFKCPDCDTAYGFMSFSPRGFNYRTEEEALEAAYRSFHSDWRLARQSVCPACSGKMETHATDDLSEHFETALEGEVLASMKCKVCNNYFYGDLTTSALTTLPVERFFADHGRDAALVQGWEDVVMAADESQTVLQTDPLRIRLTFALENEKLDITLGEELQVVSAERSSR